MKKLLLLLLVLPVFLSAQGGMWIPSLLEKLNEKEMQDLGFKLTADDLYNINKPSIKDAICLFGGGCTGEMISGQGLLLTNHHCGFGAIQNHSSVEKNYVDEGFWAANREQELYCPGVTATFISRIEDVTKLALQGVTDAMPEQDRQSQIDRNLNDIRNNTRKESWEEIAIRPFYNGNQYYLFVTVTYKDLRLVGAPPSSIGKFGADTDNWVWPRHTGDFSLFRIYAGPDNRPAEYAETNVPFQPRHFLPISLDGVSEGDFTLVYGFPGRTDEYLSEAAVRQVAEVLNPARVEIRDRALKIMDGFMRNDLEIKIAYVARYAGIANAWKKWLGEMQGLKAYGALEKKQSLEQEFTRRIRNNPGWNIKYGNILPRLNQLYSEMEPYAYGRDYFLEVFVRNTELFGMIAQMNRWIKLHQSGDKNGFSNQMPDVARRLEGFYKDYHPAVDQAVTGGLLELYGQNMPKEWGGAFVSAEAERHGGYEALAAHLFQNSMLTDAEQMKARFAQSAPELGEALSNDPAVLFYQKVADLYQESVAPQVNALQTQINIVQRQYMAAQMEVFPEKRFFPDANSTLRVTYGKVKGYTPRDAVQYHYQTYLDGVMEKYVPGDYEFDVPARLIELWKNKDYGPYAAADGRMPVAFIGTNHTTGGNSGSPALDARGNLIGLNFDRVWEGTMSDLNYDPAICRNIMVDIRYVLFIIDKYGGAKHLIEEMKLVQGKKSRPKGKK